MTVQAPSPHSKALLNKIDKMHDTKDNMLTRHIPKRRQHGRTPQKQIRNPQYTLAATKNKVLDGKHVAKKKKDRPLQLSRAATSK